MILNLTPPKASLAIPITYPNCLENNVSVSLPTAGRRDSCPQPIKFSLSVMDRSAMKD